MCEEAGSTEIIGDFEVVLRNVAHMGEYRNEDRSPRDELLVAQGQGDLLDSLSGQLALEKAQWVSYILLEFSRAVNHVMVKIVFLVAGKRVAKMECYKDDDQSPPGS